MEQSVTINLQAQNERGNVIKINIEGQSAMPFWKHDLKFEVIKTLLGTIDKKDFYEAGKHQDFHKQLRDIEELIRGIE